MYRVALFLINFLILQIVSAQIKQPKDSIVSLDEVILSADVIFGSKFAARNRTGSAYFISDEEIKKFGYTDVGRLLGKIPGINIVEEDGFGLRPNISLRGTSPERSAKITIMEDGVLIAPAPYSAPAAYYFPTIGRMESVEILKGSSQVQFGPYTTGGAINMLSTSVPKLFKARVNSRYGTFNTSRLQAMVGDSKKHFGYMIEFLNYNSDGFKNLDNEEDTGFVKNDIVAKFKVNTAKAEGTNHTLEFKWQYANEDSDETYLGLTNADFKDTPFRRYAGSQEDEMITEHMQLTTNYKIDFGKQFRITTTGYLNSFSRNWYKLNDVVFEGSKVKINDLLESPNDFPNEFAIVKGDQNAVADALYVKANNREYASKGIQTKLDYHFYGENTFHDIEVGLRYHYDEEDRFQWVDLYGITDGVTNLTTAGTPGTDANRISSAIAFASFAMYKFKYKDLTLTPGVRYENISLVREDYGKSDVNRTGIDLSKRENKVNIFIPGIGFNYNLDSKISLFGGIHKGFAPPGSQDGEQPEESVNYELGSRFSLFGISGELVGFYNDYSNLLGSDTASSGGTGNLDQFNAGEVTVSGLELLINYNLLQEKENLNLPITVGYTYTNARFDSSFGSEEDLWGEVTAGDELPYIAKHKFSTSLSLEHKKFQLNLNGRFSGAFRTKAGQDTIPENEKIASNFILDFAGKYHLNKHLNLTANIINLLDETYAVSRVPAGLRPGHPFGVYAGFQLRY